jgi:beta-galactosidase GanA
VRPYELKQWCYEALAGGAKGLIYWMWRPFTKGLQTSGRGLVDYKERSTPRLEFARELSKTVADTGVTVPVRSKVGILYDPLCLDFSIFYTKNYNVDKNIYLNSLCGAYGAMLGAGVRSDIVTVDEIENYKVLILTNHITVGKECAAKLEKFVRDGGTVICDGKIGFVDDEATLSSVLPGGYFNNLMGLEYLDADYEGLEFTFNGESLSGYYEKEISAATDGEVLASFKDGSPAVVKKSTGKGSVITFNTYVWYAHGKNAGCSAYVSELLAREYGLRDVEVTAPLMARISENEKGRFAYVFNYTDMEAVGTLCFGDTEKSISLGAHDCVIVKL